MAAQYSLSSPKKENLIVRSTRPLNLETPVQMLNSWLTPNNLFYVRTHFDIPQLNVKAWSLQIDGEVEKPLSLSMDDLDTTPLR